MTKRLGWIWLGALVMVCASQRGQAEVEVQAELFKLVAGDGAALDEFGRPVGVSGTMAVAGSRFDDDNGANSGSAYVFDVRTGLQIFKLLPDDGAASDQFGVSVAISGATVVVGAGFDDDNGANSGSAYVFDVTTGPGRGTAPQLFKLIPSDNAAGDVFGGAVAVSETVAVIGARFDNVNGNASGSAYVFDVTTGQELCKLTPSDGAAGDQFGFSVAVSGTVAVVGARFDDDNGADSGSAYVFDVTTGQQLFKLLPDDGAADDFFGDTIALSGTTAVVGAFGNDDNGGDSGSAYVFDVTTGLQRFKLAPGDNAAGDFFGSSVTVSGAMAVVGAIGDDENGANSGAAHVFDVFTGEELVKLLPSDGMAGDFFGGSVAMSGRTALVGAALEDDGGINAGAAFVFNVTTERQLSELLASDGAAGDSFGGTVAVSGTLAVAGANGHDDNGGASGAAYLFDTTTGLELFELLPNDGAAGDRFGLSVGVSGLVAIVGAHHDDDNGADSGSAYLFKTETGQQLFKLLASDGAAGDEFGVAVGMDGTTAVIGAGGDAENGANSGSAYLFSATTGQQLFKLLASDNAAGDFFGRAVAMSGATAIIGASGDDDFGASSGSAYLFDAATGQELFKLLPGDGAMSDQFGFAVAVSGTVAVVGAQGDDDNGVDSGSAYVFDVTTGQELFKLLPSDGAIGDRFGRSVAVSGTTAVIGADRDDDNGSLAGSAYVFDVTTGEQLAKLFADGGTAGDSFGDAIALSGKTAVVGAFSAATGGITTGAAYAFDVGPIIAADFSGDGCVGSADMAQLLGAWGAGGATDLNCDGATGAADLAILLGSWGAGCF